ncbi:DUF883 domain-containing protein [Alteromonas sp. CNT1-28]|jgi:ElaB/YqjD/DUF883 family membrane-anchored ribosome-binding protein|uniref:DUF883 domain-containing protein n=1 Tax=Alteromonas sp. CNT1-28 TaxID=2917730 RepID=UPI001EF21AC5|nr:DUF883 domain-containing protein [Alteromonas sp. CNT1-28]MCG7638439.1 DUF883 domain-containing protein [Alteromonas sp. CNT1-28]
MATQASAKSQTVKRNGTNNVAEPSHPVTDQLKDSLHASVDKLADSAGIAEENIRRTATASAENMSARKRLAQQKWQASKVRRYAIENPVATAGIAFAAGMLVTSLLRKK